ISTAQNHLIESKYLYFNLNRKALGTGSEPHYHPNELVIFVVEGKINALIGKDRKVIKPGTLGIVPPNARHSFKATEDGDCAYLYIKENSWGLVGIREDEAPPEESLSVDAARKMTDEGAERFYKKDKEKSQVRIEGLRPSFYPILEKLGDPIGHANRMLWHNGERVEFGFFELPDPYEEVSKASDRDQFLYMLQGAMDVTVEGNTLRVGPGDVVEINVGQSYSLRTDGSDAPRFARVRPTPAAVGMIDAMPPKEKTKK
ncbi:MAG: cupin domain-containing protein, partial [Rhodospirillales bacterium]